MILCLALTACGGGATGAEQLALDIRGEYLAMELYGVVDRYCRLWPASL